MEHILWLSCIVLPSYAQEFGIKQNNRAGWISGMLEELEKRNEIEVDLCFPIYDKLRMKNGECNGHKYYTFHCKSVETYDDEMVEEFEQILEISKPNLIHIWGVEFSFATAMLHACQRKGILNRVVASIQGLTSNYVRHYCADIPTKYVSMKSEDLETIEEGRNAYECRGRCEIEAISMLQHIIGRTDWDYAVVNAVSPDICYYHCDEILRSVFYENMGRWKYENCQKFRIFVSQATYPVKGLHYLLQAMPIIIRKYPGTHIYIAGKNIIEAEKKIPYACYLIELIEENHLQEHVTFIGNLNAEQMVDQYIQANVFVSASSIENSSNSLNEAMLVGTPSVASYVGGTNNRMTTGEEGFLYPHDEPDLLAFYICRVFENMNGLCDKLSANAVMKMSQLVDKKINVKRTLDIYSTIMEISSKEMPKKNEAVER